MTTVTSAAFTSTPLFMQAVSGDTAINYTSTDFTNLISSTWQSPGIIGATSFKVTQADTVGWTIKIAAGKAIVGNYVVSMTAALTLSVSTFNTAPTALRTHRVYLIVNDKAAGQSEYAAHIVAVEDTGSGATAPTAAGVLLLAAFTITTGQSNIQNANISAKPRHASMDAGGVAIASYLATGYSDATVSLSVAPLRVFYGNARIHFTGGVQRTAGTDFTGGTSYTFGTLPAEYRPLYQCLLIGTTSGESASATGPLLWRLIINTDGTMVGLSPTGASPGWWYLDGITYQLD